MCNNSISDDKNIQQEVFDAVNVGHLIPVKTSLARIYVSRVSGAYFVNYSGKYGYGFALYSPNWKSNRFSYVTYYVYAREQTGK